MRVLIVDDDPGVRTSLARALEVDGYLVSQAEDGAQALASLHADHIDDTLVAETLGCVLKDVDDMKRFRAEVAKTGLATFLPAAAS